MHYTELMKKYPWYKDRIDMLTRSFIKKRPQINDFEDFSQNVWVEVLTWLDAQGDIFVLPKCVFDINLKRAIRRVWGRWVADRKRYHPMDDNVMDVLVGFYDDHTDIVMDALDLVDNKVSGREYKAVQMIMRGCGRKQILDELEITDETYRKLLNCVVKTINKGEDQ